MHTIWENPDWPCYVFDEQVVARAYDAYLIQKQVTDIVFGFLDSDVRIRMHAQSLSEEIQSSLEIEGESIAYESVFSSICRKLDVHLEQSAKSDRYAESIASLALDATDNLETMTKTRIMRWHSLLFSSLAGLKPKRIGEYRDAPVYISRGNGKDSQIIYEGLSAVRIEEEMGRLVDFINEDNEQRPLVKSAIVSLWFLCIHPFEDGNGRISRALSDYVISKSFGVTHRVYSMSSLILKHRNAYYQLLNAISGQAQSLDLTQWITWNINIAIQAKQQAIRVYEKRVRLTHFMKQLDPSVFNSRQFSMLFKLADGTFEGKLTTDKWAKMNKCSPAAATRDIQHLLQEGLLVPSGDTGPKTGYFLNPAVMERVL